MKTKMTLGVKIQMLVLALMIALGLAGCGKNEVTIHFGGGETLQVSETEATEMQEDGLIDENNFYVGESVSQDEMGKAPECDVDTRKFYYDQLTDIEQEIYDNLMNSTELFIDNQNVFCCSYGGEEGVKSEYHDYITRAVYAYMYDNPLSSLWLNRMEITIDMQTVYVNGEYSHIESFDLYLTPAKETGRYADFETPAETRAAIKAVESEVKSFVSTLTGTDEEKYTQIHDWIIAGASYDDTVSVPNLRSVYGAIIQKNCVCAGFAYAFKYVADEAELNAVYVTGIGQDEPHAWNHVWLNNSWMLVDVTWDLHPILVFTATEEPTREYINEDGYLVQEYDYVSTEESNYNYLFVDIQEEAANGMHLEESELGFKYLR